MRIYFHCLAMTHTKMSVRFSSQRLLYIVKYQMISTDTPHTLCVGTILKALHVPTALGERFYHYPQDTRGDSKVWMGPVVGKWTQACSPRERFVLTFLYTSRC